MEESIRLSPEQAQEFIKSLEFKKLPKWKRFIFAIKHASPERILYNKFWGMVGVCIGMFCAIVYLIILKVYWMMFFMPFILFVQLFSLLETYQHLKQIQQLNAQLEAIKGG